MSHSLRISTRFTTLRPPTSCTKPPRGKSQNAWQFAHALREHGYVLREQGYEWREQGYVLREQGYEWREQGYEWREQGYDLVPGGARGEVTAAALGSLHSPSRPSSRSISNTPAPSRDRNKPRFFSD